MFRIFMLSVWAGGAYFLIKSYVVGVTELPIYQRAAHEAVKNWTITGPFASYKDMGDFGMWFHIGALISLLIYGAFTKQVWKEFGPNA